MPELDYFTPVLYGPQATVWQKIQENADTYLYRGHMYAYILPEKMDGGHQQVEIRYVESSQFKRYVLNALKIASYFIVVFPLFAHLIKHYRSKFYLGEDFFKDKTFTLKNITFPTELKFQVFSHLDPETLVQVSRVSKFLYDTSQEYAEKIEIKKLFNFDENQVSYDRIAEIVITSNDSLLRLEEAFDEIDKTPAKFSRFFLVETILKKWLESKLFNGKEKFFNKILSVTNQVQLHDNVEDEYEKSELLLQLVRIKLFLAEYFIEKNLFVDAEKALKESFEVTALIRDNHSKNISLRNIVSMKVKKAKKQIENNEIVVDTFIEMVSYLSDPNQDQSFNDHVLNEMLDLKCLIAQKQIESNKLTEANDSIKTALSFANDIQDDLSKDLSLKNIVKIILKLAKKQIENNHLTEANETTNAALAITNEIQDDFWKDLSLNSIVDIILVIAKKLIENNQLTEANETINVNLAIANDIQCNVWKNFSLDKIVDVKIKIAKNQIKNNQLTEANETINAALAIANDIQGNGWKNRSLNNIVEITLEIAKKQIENNQLTEANETINAALAIANDTKDHDFWKNNSLDEFVDIKIKIAKKQIKNNQLTEANETINAALAIANDIVDDDSLKDYYLDEIADIKIKIAKKTDKKQTKDVSIC